MPDRRLISNDDAARSVRRQQAIFAFLQPQAGVRSAPLISCTNDTLAISEQATLTPNCDSRMPELEIICDDGPVLAVSKPPGVITQGAPAGVDSLVGLVKQYLKVKYDKPGNVYLGVPHRLDRPVSGVVVFSKNSKCAARLAEQFRERQVEKTYWAVVDRAPDVESASLTDHIRKIPDVAEAELCSPNAPGAKECRLSYRLLERRHGRGLLEVKLETGRMHQIRVQLAARGCTIVGDGRYGSKSRLLEIGADVLDTAIGLHAARLKIQHPIRYEPLEITAPAPASWRRFGFTTLL